jgi:uncharacterized GH25 family protein
MIRRLFFLTSVLMLVAASRAGAHGVNVEVTMEGKIVAVRSTFSPTQPLADALVTIYSPVDLENAWQTGRTDRGGFFAFMPDNGGEWIFVVDDQKGHMKRIPIAIADDMSSVQEEIAAEEHVDSGHSHSHMSKSSKLITGLSLIFGITGIFYGIRARKPAGTK